jgi:hypothetical protein
VKHYVRMIPVLALSLIGGVLSPVVKADGWNKKTTITINQPIDIQNTNLPAGSYVIKLLDSPAERYIVQIFDAAEKRIITTVFAIPVYRDRAAGNSDFTFYNFENGQPAALHTWFYPGDSTGFEFTSTQEKVGAQARRRHTNATMVNAGGD